MTAECKKIIIHDSESYCLFSELPKKAKIFTLSLGDLTLNIDGKSYGILKEHDLFQTVKKDIINGEEIYALRPLRNPNETVSGMLYLDVHSLATGSFGSVSKYPIENIVSKKSSRASDRKNGIPQDILKEIAIYKLLSVILCLPKMYDYSFDKDITIDFEAGAIDLFDYIVSEQYTKVSYQTKKYIMFQLAYCMSRISSQGIINCDIKPDNIILSGDKAMIIDWGMSAIDRTRGQTRLKKAWGSLGTMAPEVLEYYIYQSETDFKFTADIWSLGCVFLSLLTRAPLHSFQEQGYSKEAEGVFKKIFKEDTLVEVLNTTDGEYHMAAYLSIRKNLPVEALPLLTGMLNPNPKLRFNYREILNSPFFSDIEKPEIKPLNFLGSVEPFEITENTEERETMLRYLDYISRHSPDIFSLAVQLYDILEHISPHDSKKSKYVSCITLMIMAMKLYGVNYESYLNIISPFLISDKSGFDISEREILEREKEIVFTLQGHLLVPTLWELLSFTPKPRSIPELLKIYMNPNYLQILDDLTKTVNL